MAIKAQSGTNSPYSQYGLGVLSDQTSGFNRGMNGLGLALREHNQVNFLNPASYSAMDSLTFIFDMGLSGQITSFSENGVKKNAKNADFEYAVAGFRAFKHVGVSFGILPLTNVGYNYSSTGFLNGKRDSYYTNSYNGDGGIHQVFLGAGWEPITGFSFGANFSYVWGDYTKNVTNAYSDQWAKTLQKTYSASVSGVKVELGAQYSHTFSKKDELTVGLTYGFKQRLSGTPRIDVISTDPVAAQPDSVSYSVKNGLYLPANLGLGFAWRHLNQWKVGLDYSLQQWGSVKYPLYSVVDGEPVYALSKDFYKDRHKVTVGGEYCNNELSRNFLKRVRLRFGASYATPYYKINGQDGPKELSMSLGFGIPIVNGYNNRSMLNISGQWINNEAKGMIKENTFRLNIGLTFNERWFMKWKVD